MDESIAPERNIRGNYIVVSYFTYNKGKHVTNITVKDTHLKTLQKKVVPLTIVVQLQENVETIITVKKLRRNF